jgi:hypothetical protein
MVGDILNRGNDATLLLSGVGPATLHADTYALT